MVVKGFSHVVLQKDAEQYGWWETSLKDAYCCVKIKVLSWSASPTALWSSCLAPRCSTLASHATASHARLSNVFLKSIKLGKKSRWSCRYFFLSDCDGYRFVLLWSSWSKVGLFSSKQLPWVVVMIMNDYMSDYELLPAWLFFNVRLGWFCSSGTGYWFVSLEREWLVISIIFRLFFVIPFHRAVKVVLPHSVRAAPLGRCQRQMRPFLHTDTTL